MRRYKRTISMIPLLSGLLMAPIAMAEEGTPQDYDQPEQLDQRTINVDQEQLELFVDAYIDVGEIHAEYSDRLQGVEAAEQAQELQQEANDKMVEAIRDNGLSVEDYSEIAAAIEHDPEMRDDVITMIEERQ